MKAQYIIIGLAIATALFITQIQPNYDNSNKQEFIKFKASFGKDYNNEEEIYRYGIFVQNLQKIAAHNSDQTQNYTMGITQFADMNSEEFIDKILMKDVINRFNPMQAPEIKFQNYDYPQTVDWRVYGAVTDVKNQRQCGSCWAFSTTGVLESRIAIATGTLNNFAEQQLVDCCGDKGYQCQGCNGAWPEWALNYVNAQGIVQQDQYTYNAVKQTCKDVPTAKKYLNSAKPWSFVQQIDNIKQYLWKNGPVSICADASNWSLYKSGVFSNCGTKILNHAILVVGYEPDGNWIVKNSWGTSWGESGYIRLAPGNTCGLAQHAVVPNLA